MHPKFDDKYIYYSNAWEILLFILCSPIWGMKVLFMNFDMEQ